MLYPLSYEGGDAFALVRALRAPLRHRRTSRSVMVRRGLAAAYAGDAAPGVLVTGLLLANEQRLSRSTLVRAVSRDIAAVCACRMAFSVGLRYESPRGRQWAWSAAAAVCSFSIGPNNCLVS
jgi:hypothetical protein